MDSRISLGMARACQRLNRMMAARRWAMRSRPGATPKTCMARVGRSAGLPPYLAEVPPFIAGRAIPLDGELHALNEEAAHQLLPVCLLRFRILC